MFGWHQVARQQRREGISGGRRARAVYATGNVLRHGEERISESLARLVHAERNGKVARALIGQSLPTTLGERSARSEPTTEGTSGRSRYGDYEYLVTSTLLQRDRVDISPVQSAGDCVAPASRLEAGCRGAHDF